MNNSIIRYSDNNVSNLAYQLANNAVSPQVDRSSFTGASYSVEGNNFSLSQRTTDCLHRVKNSVDEELQPSSWSNWLPSLNQARSLFNADKPKQFTKTPMGKAAPVSSASASSASAILPRAVIPAQASPALFGTAALVAVPALVGGVIASCKQAADVDKFDKLAKESKYLHTTSAKEEQNAKPCQPFQKKIQDLNYCLEKSAGYFEGRKKDSKVYLTMAAGVAAAGSLALAGAAIASAPVVVAGGIAGAAAAGGWCVKGLVDTMKSSDRDQTAKEIQTLCNKLLPQDSNS